MSSVKAIYENGVFRPVDKIDLPERTEVVVQLDQAAEFGLRSAGLAAKTQAEREAAYERAMKLMVACPEDLGIPNLASRHNEHW